MCQLKNNEQNYNSFPLLSNFDKSVEKVGHCVTYLGDINQCKVNIMPYLY